MHLFACYRLSTGALFLLWTLTLGHGAEPNRFAALEEKAASLVQEGRLVGAQVCFIPAEEGEAETRNFGTVSPDLAQGVDSQTLFLIASCSKPFASLCVLDMVGDAEVDLALQDRIDKWLPAFATMQVVGGEAAQRAPTVEELLSHRSGIYSQKVGMTPAQTRWIRDFRVDLKTSVDGISRSPLIAQPGTEYAYSGAGYCVLGQVAELASGFGFETMLQERVCEPLGLLRTTYFPATRFEPSQIATGAGSTPAPHQLGEVHKLPLIGGSLYSTATEMATFAHAIYRQWQAEDVDSGPFPIKPELIHELGKPRSAASNYSLGWKVMAQDGKAQVLSHSGSLNAYRAWMAVDLETGNAIAGCWTLGPAKGRQAASLIPDLQQILRS